MSAPWLSRTRPVTRNIGEIPEDVKAIVRLRAGGKCECCGHNIIHGLHAFHHRRPKGMGGSRDSATHAPANVVLICRSCHTDVHANPVEARAHGWIVRQGAAPARVMVLLWTGKWAFLGESYEVLPAGGAA